MFGVKLKTTNEGASRLRLAIRGAVQGVGFRPFVYRLAMSMGLRGWVNNSPQGVFIEVEGDCGKLDEFIGRLKAEKPAPSFIQSLETSYLDPVGYIGFEVRPSDEGGPKTAIVLPDIATCPDCLREIFDPANRRYRYPFTNCTNCGPRYTIIEALPYDRANTSMKRFTMCSVCQAEYDDPADRRFHAQPNACPVCGPHLELWDERGQILSGHNNALMAACREIRQGKIVAIKGIGGFHLVVDARNADAVHHLRTRKAREEKPFALMYPTLQAVMADCQVSEAEARLLQSPESPIVLLRRKNNEFISQIADNVAPQNPYLGVMLPYSPLHHLLLAELGFPIVATSGNCSDEPICIDEREALDRLSGIADLFLVHNRPILRHVDDSIARVMMGRESILRRSRGYAPLPIYTKNPLPSILAVGAHLKNTIAVSVDHQAVTSQHIGDLETTQAYDAFENVAASMKSLYDVTPGTVACDLHPDYLSTKYARKSGLSVVAVQHHYAHILSCMAENELDGPLLGVSWDGTGLGSDGTIWGGEFLQVSEKSFARFGHLRTFHLPGGDKAIVEPRRTALGLLYEIYGDKIADMSHPAPAASFSAYEMKAILSMLRANLNSPITSSAGRLFDAVSALVGLCRITRYEGQAAMMLEFAISPIEADLSYTFAIGNSGEVKVVDWEPTIRQIIEDINMGQPVGVIAARFHNTLAEMIVDMAKLSGQNQIVLSGGCFQNKYLTERTIARLREESCRPYWHQRIPPNDGGIALGQLMAAAREIKGK